MITVHNVPGALNSNKGLDFRAVLEAFTGTEVPYPRSGRWTTAGMVRGGTAHISWCVYNAQHFGTAQRRRRIFLVADFGGERSGEILFIPKSLQGYFEAGGTPRQGPAAYALRGIDGTMPDKRDINCLNPRDTQQTRIFTDDGSSPTLAGADGGGGRNPAGLVFAAFSGGAGEKVRSIGYSETVSPTLKSGACGFNAPCLCEPKIARTLTARGDSSPCADRGANIIAIPAPDILCEAVGVHKNQAGDVNTADTAYSLATTGNTTSRNASPACAAIHAFSLDSTQSNSMKSSNPYSGCREVETARTVDTTNPYPSKNQGGIAVVEVHPDICGTLCASGAGLSRPAGMASETDLCVVVPSAGAIPIQDKATRCNGGGDSRNNDGAGNGLGVGKEGDPAPTITSGDRHAVAVDCRNFREVAEISGTLQAKGSKAGYSLNCQNPVRLGYIVRRLTPVECERLQGYPDGWTAKTHDDKPISDTARYMMLGNSVAVPCVAYILSGIAELHKKEVNNNG